MKQPERTRRRCIERIDTTFNYIMIVRGISNTQYSIFKVKEECKITGSFNTFSLQTFPFHLNIEY